MALVLCIGVCMHFSQRVGWCARGARLVDAVTALWYICYADFCSASVHELGMGICGAWQRFMLDVCEVAFSV